MHGLYAITDSTANDPDALVCDVEAALTGGAVMIQYREKRMSNAWREDIALRLQVLCRERGAPLIINDDVKLARRINADGVHLGRDDVALADARQMLGPGKIIGVSCYADLKRARQAEQQGASYVAFGRFFLSGTKPDAPQAPVDILSQAKAVLQVPVVAIGGITADNGEPLIKAGADMLAVVQGVFGQPDVTQAAQKIAALFRSI